MSVFMLLYWSTLFLKCASDVLRTEGGAPRMTVLVRATRLAEKAIRLLFAEEECIDFDVIGVVADLTKH